MTPGAEFLVLGRGHIRQTVKMHYFFNNLLLYTQAQIRQSKYVVMMTKEVSTKIINFMTPGAEFLVLGRGHIRQTVKMHYFFKNRLFYSQAQIRQTKYLVMMTKEGSTKIVNFMTHGAGVLVLGCGHIVKMHYFFKIFFSTPRHRSNKLSVQ